MSKAQISQIFIAAVLILACISVIFTSQTGMLSITGLATASVSNVYLNSSYATNYTTENLTVTWTSTDSDGDSVYNITDWRVNGTSIAVLNMPFENTSIANTNVTDYSTYGQRGIVSGALFNRTGGHDGYGAYQFDGKDDLINISNSASLEIDRNITIELWLYTKAFDAAWSGLVALQQNGQYDYGLWIAPNGTFEFYSDDLTPASYATVDNISLDKWVHLAAVYEKESSVKIYINGEMNKSFASTSGTISYGAPPLVMGHFATYDFNGTIDDLRIYDRALSANQIKEHYRNRTNVLISNETTDRVNYSAVITPNDGADDGTAAESNFVYIRDATAPVISYVNYVITNESADIIWYTDENANSSLDYGQTLSLGTNSQNAAYAKSHRIVIGDLTNGTTYFYNITSCDVYGNCGEVGSSSSNFTTLNNYYCVNVSTNNPVHYSGTFCPGTYGIANGVNINVSNLELKCNGTVLSGAKTASKGAFSFYNVSNVTLGDCKINTYSYGTVLAKGSYNKITNSTVLNSTYGIYIASGTEKLLLQNNTINTTDYGIHIYGPGHNISKNRMNGKGLGLGGIYFGIQLNGDASETTIYENLITSYEFGIDIRSSNNTIFNNTIVVSNSAILLFGSNNTFIENNLSNNDVAGVEIKSTATSNLITATIFLNNTKDIYTSSVPSIANTLVLLISGNELTIISTLLNIISQASNIFTADRIFAVNTSGDPGLDVASELTFTNISSAGTPLVYNYTNFTTSPEDVIANGTLCPVALCTNKTYDSTTKILKVNVTGFSSYAAEGVYTAPEVNNVLLNSTSATNYTNENLTVYWNSTDADGEGVYNITDWRINGTSIAVLNMPFENHTHNTSNITFDYSTFGNNGTIINGTFNATAGYDGKGAYRFRRDITGYITVGNSTSLQPPKLTASFWIKRETDWNNTANGFIYSKNDNNWEGKGWYIESYDIANANDAIVFYVDGINATIVEVEPNDFYPLNEWIHIAATFNSHTDTIKVYKNGVLQTTSNIGTPNSITPIYNKTYIGYMGPAYDRTINGSIDDVRIYSRDLSAKQIMLLYKNRTDLLVSDETRAGENWSVCITPNDGTDDGTTACSNNLTIRSVPAAPPSDGGGTAPPAEEPVPEVPLPEVEEPIPPVTETPVAVETSITPSQINPRTVACSQISEETISEIIDFKPFTELMPGYETVVPEFKVDCISDSMKLTLTLPDTYTDVQALRCKDGMCGEIKLEETTRLTCGEKIFKTVERTTAVLTPELFPLEFVRAESVDTGVLESSNAKLLFTGKTGKVSVDKPSEPVEEPKNPMIKIVGTPVVVEFEQVPESANITLPYAMTENIDELSIALYARKDNQWAYLGGDVDAEAKKVTAEIKNAEEYAENNKITAAAMGLICLNCFETEFRKVYEGGSRDSVVLVHGFENTPERFEDIINDIKLTNQPWQVWTFGYPSSRDIDKNAKDFADLLEAHAGESDFTYIAAHSLGGVITQQAVYHAYTENQKIPGSYRFVDKIVKLVLIASPNKGALTQNPENLFNVFINSGTLTGLFNIKSSVIKEIIAGKEIPRIPGIEYLVIAGTQPYEFTKLLGLKETSDGLVSLESAQTVGGELINNSCDDFWSFNTTHTDILNNYDSRKIIEKIVAKEIIEVVSDKAVLGGSSYYDLNVAECSPDDRYIIIGKKISGQERPDPTLCNCGNGVCGVGENEVNCPGDCARIEKPKASIWGLLLEFKPLRNALLGLVLVIIAVTVLVSRRRRGIKLPPMKPKKPLTVPTEAVSKMLTGPESLIGKSKAVLSRLIEPPSPSDEKRAKSLNNLIIRIRSSLRLRDYSKAELDYEIFKLEYSSASTKIKEKFMAEADEITQKMKENSSKRGAA